MWNIMRPSRLCFIMLVFPAAQTKWLHFLKIAIYIAGYVAKKLKERFGDCYNRFLIGYSGDDNPNFLYVKMLWRGGLIIPSRNLVSYVCTAFAILELVNDLITKYAKRESTF